MKKLTVLLLIFGLFAVYSTTAISATKKDVKVKTAAKPTVGKVICLTDYLATGKDQIKKDDALAQAEKGHAIVLLVGEGKKAKIYFILNEDGSFGSKSLAKYAANKKVAVFGKVTVKAGVNYIITEKIESFD
jgi:hypothetical protein